MMKKMDFNGDRFFDSDPAVRKIARELYESVRDLPIIGPHGHVDPKLFSENRPFPDPAELILIPDHYVFRMLYSQGIPMESLGIPTTDGSPVEQDHRKIWQVFADNFYLFTGTPTGAWLNHELTELFGIREKLDGSSAMRIYDEIQEKLESPEFLPRALFDTFNIEVLTTTDGASDPLTHHQTVRESGWKGNIIPCFRPDSVIQISRRAWKQQIEALEQSAEMTIDSYSNYIEALEKQRKFFKSMGAVSTDQGVTVPMTRRLSSRDIEAIFSRAMEKKATVEDEVLFTAHMLMEMARMSIDDGLVMQIHPGSHRNHNDFVFTKFGPDKGSDIPIQTEYTRNLHALLNEYGNDSRFSLIMFTLDESTYTRELAPLAGHYPAMKLGPPWWFHDSIEGMTLFRKRVTETAGIYNTVGFNDDTRAFPSIPARHDLSRRIDCNYLAGLVARHVIDKEDARRMSRALAYELVKKAYKLNQSTAGSFTDK